MLTFLDKQEEMHNIFNFKKAHSSLTPDSVNVQMAVPWFTICTRVQCLPAFWELRLLF